MQSVLEQVWVVRVLCRDMQFGVAVSKVIVASFERFGADDSEVAKGVEVVDGLLYLRHFRDGWYW